MSWCVVDGAVGISTKTASTRQTILLPPIGLVDQSALRLGDPIGVNKDSYFFVFRTQPDSITKIVRPISWAFIVYPSLSLGR